MVLSDADPLIAATPFKTDGPYAGCGSQCTEFLPQFKVSDRLLRRHCQADQPRTGNEPPLLVGLKQAQLLHSENESMHRGTLQAGF